MLTAVNILNELKPSASILYRLVLTSKEVFLNLYLSTFTEENEGGRTGEKKNGTTGGRKAERSRVPSTVLMHSRASIIIC